MDLSDLFPYVIAVGAMLLLLVGIKFAFGKPPASNFMGISILILGFILIVTPFWSSIAVEVTAAGWKLDLQKQIVEEQSKQIEALTEVLEEKAKAPPEKQALSSLRDYQVKLKSAAIALDRDIAYERLSEAQTSDFHSKIKSLFRE